MKRIRFLIVIPFVTAVVVVLLTLLAYSLAGSVTEKRISSETRIFANLFSAKLGAHIIDRLSAARVLLNEAKRGHISDEDAYRGEASNIISSFSDIQAINWVDPEGMIRIVVPLEDNEEAAGLNVGAIPNSMRAMAEARRLDEFRATAPLTLVQGGIGFAVYAPVFIDGNLNGYLNVVFRARPLIEDAIENTVEDFSVSVHDGSTLLYGELVPPNLVDLSQTTEINFAGRTWTIDASPTARSFENAQSWLDEGILFGGLFLALVTTALVILAISQTRMIAQKEERFDLAMKGANDGLWDRDLRTNEVYFSPRWYGMLGYSADELEESFETFRSLVHPDDWEDLRRCEEEVMAQRTETMECEFRMRHESGAWVHILSRAFVVREDGKPSRMIGTHTDLTERKQQEQEQQRYAHRLKEALGVANVGGWEISEADTLSWSPEVHELFRTSPDTFSGQVEEFYDFVHPEDLVEVQNKFETARAQGTRFSCVHRVILRDGSVRVMRQSAEPMVADDGKARRLSGVIQDISDQVELETQLQQAQKMEALGQLTSGIAHDFNNILTVIQGNAEFLEDLGGEASQFASSIYQASKTGAELIRRLLALSRQEAPRVETIDVGHLAASMSDLLRRTLGEIVMIKTITPENLWCAQASRGQLENALLNLAINARHAMPDGGELTIECANVTLDGKTTPAGAIVAPGDYVVLAVTDHGTGMTKEVQKRVFEPFFTTKEPGKGSGLGLSMVHSFARQSGGQATIYSELGKGTTIKLYLPRALTEADRKETSQTEELSRGKGELILVIEDNAMVRTVAETMLVKLGYNVVAAENARSARKVIAANPEVALVLSDIILPGGTIGPAFTEELKADYPHLAIIFMSGYTKEAARRNGLVGDESVVLSKPFRVSELASAVRDGLATA